MRPIFSDALEMEKRQRAGGRMPVEVAVRSILRQIQTETDEVLFDWKYALLARIASILPLSLLRNISKRGD